MKEILKKFVRWYLKVTTILVLRRFKPEIIAICGTVGKSRTKELIKKILAKKYSVRANPRSYNTDFGLPLAVLYLESGFSSFSAWAKILAKATSLALFSRKFPQKLILELGADQPGEMNYLLSIIGKPKVLIVTNILPSSSDGTEDLNRKANEVRQAVKSLDEDGIVILNIDNLWIKNMQKDTQAKVIFYGKDEKADIRLIDIDQRPGNWRVRVKSKDKESELDIGGVGEQLVYAHLATIACGLQFGFKLEEIKENLCQK